MRYIGFDREEEAEAWARERMGIVSEPGFFRSMASVDAQNNFVFVVVLTNFTSRNVDINIAMIGGKMTPGGILEIFNSVFSFIFDNLRLSRVTGLVPISNKRAQKVDEKFGFKREGLMRKALPDDEDLIIYGFLKEDYYKHRWYRGKI